MVLHSQVVDFPGVWHDRRDLMNAWLCLSGFTLLFAPVGFPGAVVSIVGSMLHVCRCCKPRRKFAGKIISKAIFVLALIAAAMDAVIGLASCIFSVFMLGSNCRDKDGLLVDQAVCEAQKGLSVTLLVMDAILLVHVVISLAAFVGMRECYLEIQRY